MGIGMELPYCKSEPYEDRRNGYKMQKNFGHHLCLVPYPTQRSPSHLSHLSHLGHNANPSRSRNPAQKCIARPDIFARSSKRLFFREQGSSCHQHIKLCDGAHDLFEAINFVLYRILRRSAKYRSIFVLLVKAAFGSGKDAPSLLFFSLAPRSIYPPLALQ